MICKDLHALTVVIVTITVFCHTFTLGSVIELTTVLKCQNSDVELNDTLIIPDHLLRTPGNGTTVFKLSNDSEKMNCPTIEFVNISLIMNASLFGQKYLIKKFTSDGILEVHTEDGYIHYRHIRDYCIQSTGDYLRVSVCPLICDNGEERSKMVGTTISRPCVHKCCKDPHKIVYMTKDRLTCQYPSNKEQGLKPFLLEDINKKFSVSQLDSRVNTNYFANKNFAGVCREAVDKSETYLKVPKHLYNHDYRKDSNIKIFRLSKSGSIETCINKKWVESDYEDVCVDAVQNFGREHEASGNLTTLFILRCPNPNSRPSNIKSTNDTTENDSPINSSGPQHIRTDILYYGILPTACFFLFITIIVYLLLWERQNIHGKTVLSYIVSLFLFFFSLCLSQAWHTGSKMCHLNAVIAHFFFILTFSWLTAINFDIYWTFRKLQISSKVKNNKQFILYAIACWIVPLIFVTVGISLDNAYGNASIETCTPEDEESTSWIKAPQYGKMSCYISESAQGFYDYFVGFVFFCCNVVFFSLTVHKLCQHRKSANAAMQSSSQEDKPVRLFGKLLAVMGAGWIFEFIGWIVQRSSGESRSVYWIVYICDWAALLQAIALFVIFVCKKQIFDQLWQKYDNLRCMLSIFTRYGCCEVPPDRKNTLTTTHHASGKSTLTRDHLESTPLTLTDRIRKDSVEMSEIQFK